MIVASRYKGITYFPRKERTLRQEPPEAMVMITGLAVRIAGLVYGV